MTDLELCNIIATLHSAAGIVDVERLDIAITLSKMSDEQIADLAAMIDYLDTKNEPCFVLSQVMHDLRGLKAGFLGLSEGDCFSPRSSGYADRVA